MIFQWDNQLETGISLIDNQHKQFMEMSNTFFIQYKFGPNASSLQKYMDFLQNYVQSHFPAEEAYQAKSNYPKYRIHQSTHQYLTTRLKFLSVRMNQQHFDLKVYDEFFDFLNEWVQKHVLQDDLDFSLYWKQQNKKKLESN